jgi:hypothetical protein
MRRDRLRPVARTKPRERGHTPGVAFDKSKNKKGFGREAAQENSREGSQGKPEDQSMGGAALGETHSP